MNDHEAMRHALDGLRATIRLAIERHRAARARQPQRARASYLRVAISGARRLAGLTKYDPLARRDALALLEEIAGLARGAEAEVFNAGGDSAPFLAVIIAAEAASAQLAGHEAQPPRAARAPERSAPTFASPPALPRPDAASPTLMFPSGTWHDPLGG